MCCCTSATSADSSFLTCKHPQIPRRTSASHNGHVADSDAALGTALLCGGYAPSLFLTEVNRSCVKLHRADRTRQEVGHEEGLELFWLLLGCGSVISCFILEFGACVGFFFLPLSIFPPYSLLVCVLSVNHLCVFKSLSTTLSKSARLLCPHFPVSLFHLPAMCFWLFFVNSSHYSWFELCLLILLLVSTFFSIWVQSLFYGSGFSAFVIKVCLVTCPPVCRRLGPLCLISTSAHRSNKTALHR